ncbi:glycine zipper 2TM domain-containing protein [Sphingosinicella rhizophila]|uniref:17 kDa surface antigen n=1 Tax=Sphingosinicella rhizophila TaxID=3050082 RepID=A0ABU3Q785_9SPHN|nr:glycine zipper 2TM domain-containing protein [Sphingosinicella sp. GR2756]MDT9599259.1 glycine zipper 2TM domain-containing protein [Sphingosinicella sp. GR2756]
MKNKILLALSLAVAPAALITAAPAAAQTSSEQRRWDSAQQRYEIEFQNYLRERDRYTIARMRRGGGYYDDDRYGNFETDYDATRYYRDGPNYRERVLTDQDEVYRGSDGRYYCKRSDGTTGLIIGGAGGAILGNVIDGGRSRTAGTLIGGALGALLGRSVERNQEVRCR